MILARIVGTIALIASLVGTTVATSPVRDDVVERILPAIVQIGTSAGDTNISTVGTGVIVGKTGYILTAKHNISSSQHIFVRQMDGTPHKALYYIADAHKDLALVRIAGSELPTVAIGDSDLVRAGQGVLVFGFPASRLIKGSETTASVSQGIVSAIGRELQEQSQPVEDDLEDARASKLEWAAFRGLELSFALAERVRIRHLIQLDAMMNPGSSGGAVIDSSGRLIGICHSIISNTGGNVGINFAIAINEAGMLLRVAGIVEGGRTDGSKEGGTTASTPE